MLAALIVYILSMAAMWWIFYLVGKHHGAKTVAWMMVILEMIDIVIRNHF